ARNPRGRNGTAVARRAPQQDEQYGTAAAGDPVVLTPQPREYPAQARVDDGYIYPADGSSTAQRYPAPPSARRAYGAQAYGQQQYYGNQGYAPAPQVYYQPRPNYPRQRDFYGNSYQD
ncbi:L,D-transpeptidase, partial [Neisseria gonorrhoeae]